MAVTVESFQADFTEFSNASASVIQTWINIAAQFIDQSVYSTSADFVTELFVAHNVCLTPGAGGPIVVPPGSVGPLASKGVGGASASYATGEGVVRNAGNFNLTTYGTRYAEMRDRKSVV